MPYEIHITQVESIPIAVIRNRVSAHELSNFIRSACGEVWAFVRSAGLPNPGRHVAVYLDSGFVEVGAEVGEPFIGNDRVHCSQTPAGQVVTTTHFGPYERLGEAHFEIRRWCAANGLRRTITCWEIYGHWDTSWNANPSRIRTDVFHLLEDDKG